MRAAGAVLVIGDVMTDIVVRPEGRLVSGADRRAAIRILPGGSGANQACWLAFEGIRTRFAGRVGASDHGAEIERFAQFGVEAVLGSDDRLPSGRLVTLLAPDGERSFFTDRGANDALGAADLPHAMLDDIVHLHVSGYSLFNAEPRAAVLRMMEEAKRRAIPFSIDAGSHSFLREAGAAAFLDWSRGARFCFANADEAAVLAGTADIERQFDVLIRRYETVVIKRGAEGAAIGGAAGGGQFEPASSVPAIDTTGAGDAFLAAFLAAHFHGEPVPTCLKRAVAAGSYAVTILGGRPPSGAGLISPADAADAGSPDRTP